MKTKWVKMDFEKLWDYQQGAVFLKKDMIYDMRKNLAEFFFRMGGEHKAERLKSRLDEALEFINSISIRELDSINVIKRQALLNRINNEQQAKTDTDA